MAGQTDRASAQQGSALLVVVLLIVLVLVAGGGWLVWRHYHGPQQAASSSAKTNAKDSGAADPSLEDIAKQATQISGCGSLSLSQGHSDGTAGTIYKDAVITNSGTATCTVSGYPTVKLLDSTGALLGSAAGQNNLYPSATVAISPGGQAHVVLAFPDAGAYDDTTACSASSTTLQVTIPNVAIPLTTAWQDQSCPGFTTTVFQPGA